ncbi:hypothetical protein SETIT_3G341000v2 [Setaria italica]|uniref:Uncharacterized protein n=1 Tax=Setaria italica TaxID=4555 RepID=A0A368QLT7_SETIT|nr:hypothetical protein SETIT_3G341000v2 [Setaria italica]
MLQYYTHHPFEHSNASTTSLTAIMIVDVLPEICMCEVHCAAGQIGMNQESKEKNVHLASFGRFFQSGAEQMNWRERG